MDDVHFRAIKCCDDIKIVVRANRDVMCLRFQ